MKKKVFLTAAQRSLMKEECRIAIEYPAKSHARGAAIREIAERYNVGQGVVYDMMRSTHRSPAKPPTNGKPPIAAAPAEPAPVALAAPPAAAPLVYALSVGGVNISASSKAALLEVVDRLLVPVPSTPNSQ